VIVPAAFRIHYLGRELASSDETLDGAFAAICTQIDMNYAIISATIPCLRPFITATNTQHSIPAKSQGSSRYATGTAKDAPGTNFPLASLSSRLKAPSNMGQEASTSTKKMSGWDGFAHTSSVISPGDQHSIGSQGSKQMIIRKDVEWAVNYESGQEQSHKSEASE
jgi:hypothetical protein